MKTKRFDINYKPLRLTVSLSPEGSVPGTQTYNANTAEYVPDYELTPLVLQPRIGILDKDGVLEAGSVNASIYNIKWTEIYKETRTVIDSTNTNYEIVTSGEHAGRILVKRNAYPDYPITLEFQCQYTDPRNNQIYEVHNSFLISCANATLTLNLEVDTADQTVYDPLSSADTQTVKAKLYINNVECTSIAKRAFTWEIYRGEDEGWTVVGDDVLDGFISFSLDYSTMTINRRQMMTDELQMRVRALYSATGLLANLSLSDATPYKSFSIIRKIPRYNYDIASVPTDIPSGTTEIYPEALVQTNKGQLANYEAALLPVWHIATNKTSGTLTYNQIAHGPKPTIPTDALDGDNGAILALDLVDVGPLCPLTDSDGTIITDSDGAVLLV